MQVHVEGSECGYLLSVASAGMNQVESARKGSSCKSVKCSSYGYVLWVASVGVY